MLYHSSELFKLSRIVLSCAAVCDYVLPCEVSAQVTGDPEIFRILAETARDNQVGIKTWVGSVEVVDKDTVEGILVSHRVSTITFSYSSNGDQLFFDKTARMQPLSNSDESKQYRYAAIRTKDSYYRYGPIDLSLENVSVGVRPFPLDAVKSGWLSVEFDPFIFNKVELAHRTVESFCDFYFDNRANEELMPTSIVRNGDAVVVTLAATLDGSDLIWEYHFDLGKGGLPVFVKGGLQSGKDVISTWKNDYVEIDGIWLPRELQFTLDNQGTRTVYSRNIVFADQQINVPVSEKVFDITALPMRTGDTIFDPETGKWNRFGVEESKSQPPPNNVLQPLDRTSLTRVLLVVNICIAVIAIATILVRRCLRKRPEV